MEIVLKFTISPDGEGRTDATMALNGHKYWNALWEISQAIREKYKYSQDPPTWDEVQEMFYSILQDNYIDLEEVA